MQQGLRNISECYLPEKIKETECGKIRLFSEKAERVHTMKNIMRAQIYQLLRSKAFWASLLIPLILLITNITGELDYNATTLGKFIAENAFLVYSLAMLSAIMMTCLITGGDFTDKTANYEIMSGHSRWQFFAGRAVLSILLGLIGYTVSLFLPLLIGVSIAGFGTELQVIARILCEFICLTCILQNPLIPMGIGIVLCMSSQILIGFLEVPDSFFLGITSLNRLSGFFSWMTYSMADGHSLIYSYGLKMQMEDILGIVISSIGIGGAALLLGYSFYKRDDLR